MIARGAVHWADLGQVRGSRPASRRPVVIVQAHAFNDSGVATTLVVPLTLNLRMASLPGNVFVPGRSSGLSKDSVANVTGLTVVNKAELDDAVGELRGPLLDELASGIRRVLGL
ncbi:MAG TPA: type II toxin-antitoxin system PemK/MazF family toxin [Jatrophihabitantaceae bacterium]|nr:type II toxin-antitoxin system PemK/MazF family toxin [Jatrophihabitantaceae bacterium]